MISHVRKLIFFPLPPGSFPSRDTSTGGVVFFFFLFRLNNFLFEMQNWKRGVGLSRSRTYISYLHFLLMYSTRTCVKRFGTMERQETTQLPVYVTVYHTKSSAYLPFPTLTVILCFYRAVNDSSRYQLLVFLFIFLTRSTWPEFEILIKLFGWIEKELWK